MEKEKLINKTIDTLSQLPQDRVREVNDYADYILKKYEEEILQKGVEQIISDSKSFEFLKDEEELYSTEDLREIFRCLNKSLQ